MYFLDLAHVSPLPKEPRKVFIGSALCLRIVVYWDIATDQARAKERNFANGEVSSRGNAERMGSRKYPLLWVCVFSL